MMTISTHWKVDKTFCHCSRCLYQPNGIDFKGYLVSSDLTSSTAHACHMFPWWWVLSCLVSMDTKYICATIYRSVVSILRSWVENEYLTWKWIPDLKINTWLDDEYLTLIFLWVLACEVHSVTMDQGLQNYFIYMQSSRVFFCDVWIETC